MNTTVTPVSTHGTLERYFFRTADKLRLEGCAHAVAQEAQNLTLFCQDEPLLDHYLQILLAHLKDNYPQHRVEVYFPTSPENLIQRFNQALANQDLKEASRAGSPSNEAQILVIHDPQVIADHEMQLLGRLIQSLPGANIRLILLLTGESSQAFELGSLKRRMVRWDIEAPTPDQALAALEHSEQSGQLLQLRRFLARICAEDPGTAPALTALRARPTEQGVESILHQSSITANQAQSAPNVKPPSHGKSVLASLSPKKKQVLKASVIGLVALLISTAFTVWVQPKSFGISSSASSSPRLSTSVVSESEEIVEDAPASSKPSNASSGFAANPRPSPMAKFFLPTASRDTLGAPANSNPIMPSAAPARVDEPEKSAQANKQALLNGNASNDRTSLLPVDGGAKKASTKTDRLADPDAAAMWFRALSPQNYTIWYAVLPTQDAAQSLRKSYASLATSVILATNKGLPSKPQYAVVSEPFASAGQAYAALKNASFPPNSWVRTVKDVQQELKPIGTDRSN